MASARPAVQKKGKNDNSLLQYAFFPGVNGWRTAVLDLAKLARNEDWGKNNAVLCNYLKYLYKFIVDAPDQTDRGLTQDPTGKWSVLHTRLYTTHFAAIFGLFEKNNVPNRQPWIFKYWATEFELLKDNNFDELPKPSYFCSKHHELHFDPDIPLHYDVAHIMQSDKQHGRMQKLFPGKSDGELQNLLAGAIDRAKRRVEQNSRTVVPQYFPKTKNIQLLLPLCFNGSDLAQLVLPCERVKKPGVQSAEADPLNASHWRYLASTILDMSMAYRNARLINRLESEWLTKPGELNIEDNDDADDDAKSVS